MTGYGYREFRDDRLSLSVEIKGYNSRFLEIFVNLPPFLSSIEGRIRDHIASRCERGKIELSLRFKELCSEVAVTVDQEAAKAYFRAVTDLGRVLGLDEKPKLSLLLGIDGVLSIEKVRDVDRYWSLIEPSLRSAMEGFVAERVREGQVTEADIMEHIASIAASVDLVAGHAPEWERSIANNLRTRFAELLGDAVDENRILAETAVLLMKYTISEELMRLRAHLGAFRSEVELNPAPGKKLDFLCQEINREINTIGSKSPVLEVSRAVVDMKDALENIREQLRNVE